MKTIKARTRYVIVGGDFSQQEPRLLTHMCKDPKLTETYNNKRDLYATIAAAVFKKDYWECMEHWEDGTPNPTGKGIRSKAKGLVLGIMYGMGAKLMSTILNVTIEECNDILKEFFEMFPTVKEFTLNNEEMAKKQGYVEDYMGRQRHLPDAQLPELTIKAYKKIPVDNVFFDNINSFIEDIDDETTTQWINKWLTLNTKSFNAKTKFKELAKANGVVVKDNGAFISKALTQCTNARIQGSAATLTKKAMIEISNDKRLQEIGFKILIPVHDELLGEVPVAYAEECEKLLSAAMIRAGKPECSVNMKCDTYCVKHWYTDEVANGIREKFLQYINGDTKKNIEPIPAEEAYKKLYKEYDILSQETVKQMCDETFDHLNGDL